MSSNSGSASAMLLNSCISSLYVLDTSTTCMTWRLASGACKLLKTAFKFQTSYVSRGYDGEHKRGGIIVQWWTVAVAGSPKVQCAISATCWPPRHRNRSVCKSSSLLKSLTAIDSQSAFLINSSIATTLIFHSEVTQRIWSRWGIILVDIARNTWWCNEMMPLCWTNFLLSFMCWRQSTCMVCSSCVQSQSG